jgi:hypothetical protein
MIFYKIIHAHLSLYLIAPADECARAAAIYDCAKKTAPEITNAIQKDLKNSLSAAPVGVMRRNYLRLISTDWF